ncbi:MAG TPA: YceI family protein [Candidatus Dormibacteraeota bacterium]|jgi:polyisoprenoid-binding protein YceI|nr:YceI family protein [Candidatus Dormibacteraeota bacterium]
MAQRFEIDPAHTEIGFSAKHMLFTTVRGKFRTFSGYVESADGAPLGATGVVTIEAASIDTGVEQRDAHLRSGDFLLAEEHPEIVYKLEGVTPAGENVYTLTGELTIRGVTKPLELSATVEGRIDQDAWGNERVAVNVSGEFNRKDFGVNWNQAMEAGGLLVSETVKVAVEVALVRKLAQEPALV